MYTLRYNFLLIVMFTLKFMNTVKNSYNYVSFKIEYALLKREKIEN